MVKLNGTEDRYVVIRNLDGLYSVYDQDQHKVVLGDMKSQDGVFLLVKLLNSLWGWYRHD